MSRCFLLLTAVCCLIFSIGCTTANSRSLNHRLAELETRIHRLEAGPEYAQKTIPQYSEEIETVSASEIALPERKMPKTR